MISAFYDLDFRMNCLRFAHPASAVGGSMLEKSMYRVPDGWMVMVSAKAPTREKEKEKEKKRERIQRHGNGERERGEAKLDNKS